jgi:hypothetical protein
MALAVDSYEDPVFRARGGPRVTQGVTEVGVDLTDDSEIGTWDASGTSRWFVTRQWAAGAACFSIGARGRVVADHHVLTAPRHPACNDRARPVVPFMRPCNSANGVFGRPFGKLVRWRAATSAKANPASGTTGASTRS